ncbi:immunoglobulin superfamily member 6 [Chelmon rostratus]|uniref:immunoglobulin superfamily member 6 n=1 Tax=Chelmon rostratus TaxID=109905 RepID=UPI001BEB8853|nr:immunoglobulin superfamily member 6 [Chelmon rostratus]
MQRIMRSFTSCQSTDMEWLFCFSLLLTYLPATESCLSQPNKVIWRKTGQSAVLPCTVSSNCSSRYRQYEWFTFKDNFHFRIRLDNHLKYTLDGASLRIKSLHTNDSGIYLCAAVSHGDPAPDAQHVGLGTTLVVREKVKIMVRNILLWLSFVLLAIYSLAIVTLIIKKYGCNMSICKRAPITDRDNSTKKKQFRDVLQEMYSKRNSERQKQTVSRNRPQVKAASTDLNSTDDIYQNV